MDPGTPVCALALGVTKGASLVALGAAGPLGSRNHILVIWSSIFSVLGPGLGSLGGWCPQWLLRGASPTSLEEPTSPQTLAAAQKVAGVHGAGQRRLPEETSTGQGCSNCQARPWRPGPSLWSLLLLCQTPRRVGWGGGQPPMYNSNFFPQPTRGSIRDTCYQIPNLLLT